MSLKLRLTVSIAISFLLALLLGGGLAVLRAKQSVQTEMQAALQSGADIVADAPKSTPSDLANIVRSFDGVRHLRVTLRNPAGQVVARSRLAGPPRAAPDWFAASIAPVSASARIAGPPQPAGWTLALATDPGNEIAEVWGQTRDALAALIVFCVGVGALTYLLVGRSLRFLPGFGQALGRVAEGDYGTQLDESGPPEFARLASGFNQMAFRLSQYERENKNLQRQMTEIQEEDRAEIARDLHDEVGPLLFSINVDAVAMPELAASRDVAAVKERAGRIGEAAGQIQQRVKAILRQLKPIDVLDFGLDMAIRELISFWQARFPAMQLSFRNGLDDIALDRAQEEVIYRVIQESLSNAVRHGRPKSIDVVLTHAPGEIVLTVADDGRGLPSPRPARGNGINGMTERVQNLGGAVSVQNSTSTRGVTVRAVLPLRPGPGDEVA
ncbi:MAG TPA: histidine kinase [Rhizomicrobium sp.]|nr:histidine kinase [Rhizomicrobium sp.]